MRSLLDVDGVLGDFPNEVVRFCNLYGRAPGEREWSLADVTQHDILKAFDREDLQLRLDQHMRDTDFCRYMPVYEGAQAFVESLKSFSDVVIVTASYSDVPGWEFARRAWLKEHFGIQKRDVIFAKRKELVAGNFFLDDKLHNIDEWRIAWGHQGIACVFDRPWNQGLHLRVASYDAALKVAVAASEAIKKLVPPKLNLTEAV